APPWQKDISGSLVVACWRQFINSYRVFLNPNLDTCDFSFFKIGFFMFNPGRWCCPSIFTRAYSEIFLPIQRPLAMIGILQSSSAGA
ncbi:hypothetical protein JW933_11130, partial [candidate division FCPU426 bacterium]|nr:hypothetical protein [candidate division FCPU426 bacterium]